MNARTSLALCIMLLIFSMSVAACGPVSTPTPVPSKNIEIANVVENPEVEGQVIQIKVYNQCESASSLKTQIQFSESSTASKQKELVISAGVSGEVAVSAVAKVELQGSVEERFAAINTSQKGY